MTLAYHFVGETLRDGSPIPEIGTWEVFEGECVVCESGLHASRDPFDALRYAPGQTLRLVEVDDIVTEQDDKLVCKRRRTVKQIDATVLLDRFARQCALDVIDLWEAPAVVRQYLETGDESIRSATQEAARSATRAAARSATRAAARDAAAAAWEAAWAAAEAAGAAWNAAEAARGSQRAKFNEMVNEAFK
jgi:hypothetical protein